MKNGHNDMLEPIGAIPFLFSTRSFLANGFSTLRLLIQLRTYKSGPRYCPHSAKVECVYEKR
jgi:hypothetical protein